MYAVQIKSELEQTPFFSPVKCKRLLRLNTENFTLSDDLANISVQ